MVSGGGPKIHQKSKKIHPGTFQGPSVCICDPLDCKMVPKWWPRTFKCTQNDDLGTLKVAKNQQHQIIQHKQKHVYIVHFCPLISILETSFSIPANPFSLLISSQLVARGAGGRGEALGYIYIYVYTLCVHFS